MKEETQMTNGQENGENKAGRKRDGKGRFLPGDTGGPGRGKKAVQDLLTEAETVAGDLMTSDDSALRAKGASLALKIQGFKKSDDDIAEQILDPITLAITFELIPAMQALSEKYQVDELEMIHRMGKTCGDCDRWENGDAGADDCEEEQ
jgi:hypothetical protein